MDNLDEMKYPDLQKLAKSLGINGRQKSQKLLEEIKAFQKGVESGKSTTETEEDNNKEEATYNNKNQKSFEKHKARRRMKKSSSEEAEESKVVEEAKEEESMKKDEGLMKEDDTNKIKKQTKKRSMSADSKPEKKSRRLEGKSDEHISRRSQSARKSSPKKALSKKAGEAVKAQGTSRTRKRAPSVDASSPVIMSHQQSTPILELTPLTNKKISSMKRKSSGRKKTSLVVKKTKSKSPLVLKKTPLLNKKRSGKKVSLQEAEAEVGKSALDMTYVNNATFTHNTATSPLDRSHTTATSPLDRSHTTTTFSLNRSHTTTTSPLNRSHTNKIITKKSPGIKAARKSPGRKAAARKSPGRKATTDKSPRKAATDKSPRRSATETLVAIKSPANKSPANKSPAKKIPIKKSPTKKTPTKKLSTKKSPAKRAAGLTRAAVVVSESALDKSAEKKVMDSRIPKAAGRLRGGPRKDAQYWTKFHQMKQDKMQSIGEYQKSKKARAIFLLKSPALKPATPITKTASKATPHPTKTKSATKNAEKASETATTKVALNTTTTTTQGSRKRRRLEVELQQCSLMSPKVFLPNILNVKNADFNFSKSAHGVVVKPTKIPKPFAAPLPTPAVATPAVATKSILTPVRGSGKRGRSAAAESKDADITISVSKKARFDLHESLDRPITWVPHKGPLKAFSSSTKAALSPLREMAKRNVAVDARLIGYKSIASRKLDMKDKRKDRHQEKRKTARISTLMSKRGIK